MSEEQYNFVNGYRDILTHFMKHQIYVGGADGLFNRYLQPGELGCSACKSACMIQRYNELMEYDKRNANNM